MLVLLTRADPGCIGARTPTQAAANSNPAIANDHRSTFVECSMAPSPQLVVAPRRQRPCAPETSQLTGHCPLSLLRRRDADCHDFPVPVAPGRHGPPPAIVLPCV